MASSSFGSGGSGDGASSSTGESGSVEVYNGEIAELASHEDIVQSLECPVCKEIALAPIYTCKSGHIVCYTCRQRLTSCALCKVPFSRIRNYALESIIAKSTLFCKYKEYGCNETSLGETLNEHVRNCGYRSCAPEPPSPARPIIVARAPTPIALELGPVGFAFGELEDWDPGSTSNLSDSSFLQTMGWRRARRGGIPAHAVHAGYDDAGSPAYVCRAFEGNSCRPGSICSGDGFAYLNWFGQTKSKYYYDVLVAIPGTVGWEQARRDHLPDNAVIGANQAGYERIYVGRTKVDDQWVPGYIIPSLGRCFVSNGTTAIGRRYFQYLVSYDTDATDT